MSHQRESKKRPGLEDLQASPIIRNAELAQIAEEAKHYGFLDLEKAASALLQSGKATAQEVIEYQTLLANGIAEIGSLQPVANPIASEDEFDPESDLDHLIDEDE